MSESLSRRNLLKSLALAAGGTAAAAQALISTAQAQTTPAKPAAPAAAKPAAPAAAKPAAPAAAAPAGFVKLDPKDPAAVALAYHEDSTKVDPKKYPMHKPNQFCNNCLQLQGKAGEEYRPCNLFPKKLVHQRGWCKVWVKKPGTA
jgi:long-subunit fatty acid transport protein